MEQKIPASPREMRDIRMTERLRNISSLETKSTRKKVVLNIEESAVDSKKRKLRNVVRNKKRDYVGKIPKRRTPPQFGKALLSKKSWLYFSF